MSFSYDVSLLATDSRTQVRFAVGDVVDKGDKSLHNEEIDFVLTQQTVLGFAAAECARRLAAKFAFDVNTVNGKLSVAAGERRKKLLELAAELEKQPELFKGRKGAVRPFFGGVRQSENDTLDNNTDLRQPFGRHEKFRHPYALGDLHTAPIVSEEDL